MKMRVPRPRLRAGVIAAALTISAAVVGISAPTGFAQAPNAQPAVPNDIRVPDGNKLFLVRHAVGTQDYVCVPSGGDFKFVLVTPRATLLSDEDHPAAAHYFSPNPFEGGTIRATWDESEEAGIVWGQAIQSSSDSDFVAPGAIGWVLLRAVGAESGTGGDESLTATTYIQRLNTVGGQAPSTGCNSTTDVGNQAFVPYVADYLFYESDA